jgi:Reverse transcriptase (RNA-dependent DNA polymerase)
VQPTDQEGNDADPAPAAATSNEHVAKPSFGKSAYKRNTSGVISSYRMIASAQTNAEWVHGEIQVSKCEEAFQLDRDSNTSFWIDAIRKEMSDVRIAFEECKEGTLEDIKDRSKLVGYQQIKCHLIFDIKMDFTRKARFVAGGHTTETPPSLTYSSVVSRESVRIALLISALHELDVCAADVGNAYLNAPCREKIFTIAGPEFQSEVGKVMIIKRALYGLKSSGAAWRNMLASSLMDMGYKSSLADADVWTKPNIKPDGFEYYEMILVYVDDILVVSLET